MQADVILFQLLLGLVLFFVVNWIGRHSYSAGYVKITMFTKNEDAPAVNFSIRVLTPVVFIVVVSALLYHFKLDRFVQNIYWVCIYSLTIRILYNILMGHAFLLNWFRVGLYWTSIILLSYFTYDKFIREKKNILPDFTSMANELWIIIALFIFQLANKVRVSENKTANKREIYLKRKYIYFKNKYGGLIIQKTKNQILEAVVYGIMIYENFNRPLLARLVEYVRFRITKKPHTLGVMQVHTSKFITDYESVCLGIEKIMNSYLEYIEKTKEEEKVFYRESQIYSEIIAKYNTGEEYSDEVTQIVDQILDSFYPNTKNTLRTQYQDSFEDR